MRPRIPLLNRLERHLGAPITKLNSSFCWPWLGSTNRGVPEVRVDGKLVSARRAVYELLERPLAIDERLIAKCKFPECVNPHHMAIHGVVEAAVENITVEEEPDIDVDELVDVISGLETRDPDEISEITGMPVRMVVEALRAL